MTFVVDASLATKWLVQEQDSGWADNFFAEYFGAMHAPDLLLVEVTNSLVRRVNQRVTDQDEAYDGTARLQRDATSAIILHRMTPELVAGAAVIAIRLGHPLKDCIYLALADQLGCPLATCDAKFRERVADPARVRLLAELV